jgi:branched-chain amino acid transport system substrate-binding protein
MHDDGRESAKRPLCARAREACGGRQGLLVSLAVGALLLSSALVAAPSANAASASSPIVIAVAAPVTGPFDLVDGSAAGVARGWAKWTNKVNGGVDGHPVKIVVANTKSTGGAAASILTQTVEADHPIAVVATDAAIEAPIATYLAAQDIPVIGGVGDTPTIWNKDTNYFSPFAVSTVEAEVGVAAAAAVKATNLGAVVCSEVPVCATENALFTALAPKYHLSYKGLLTASTTQPSYTSVCLAMIQKNVDALVLALGTATIQSVIQDCTDQNYKGYYLIDGTSLSQSLLTTAPSGTKATGTIAGFPWWSDAAPVKTFRSVMTKYAPGVTYKNPAATSTWSTLELFREAMSGATGQPSTTQVFDAYAKVKNQSLGGLLAAPVTFTKGAPSPVIKCAWLYKFTDGHFSTVSVGASGNGQSGDLRSSCV